MDMLTVGPWVLLGTGVFLLVVGALRKPHVIVIYILSVGFAAAGVGVYGMAFLDRHGLWLVQQFNALNAAETAADAQATFTAVVDRLSRGEIPERHLWFTVPALEGYLTSPSGLPDGFDQRDALAIINEAIDRDGSSGAELAGLVYVRDVVGVDMLRQSLERDAAAGSSQEVADVQSRIAVIDSLRGSMAPFTLDPQYTYVTPDWLQELRVDEFDGQQFDLERFRQFQRFEDVR